MGKKDLELLIMEFRLTLSFHAESRPCPRSTGSNICERSRARCARALDAGQSDRVTFRQGLACCNGCREELTSLRPMRSAWPRDATSTKHLTLLV